MRLSGSLASRQRSSVARRHGQESEHEERDEDQESEREERGEEKSFYHLTTSIEEGT
jgi:hypothetical protein